MTNREGGVWVVHRDGWDYWRTWFWEECEQHGLFGIAEKHRPLIVTGKYAYRLGTRVYLEDAPYFRATGTHHLICGPYEVVGSALPDEAQPLLEERENVIVYREAFPQKGPWMDDNKAVRVIEGVRTTFRKIAEEYDWFPIRFAIKRVPGRFSKEPIVHGNDCWLCLRKFQVKGVWENSRILASEGERIEAVSVEEVERLLASPPKRIEVPTTVRRTRRKL